MLRQGRRAIVIGLAAGFLIGMLGGAALMDGQVYARQTFGPEDVKSVPKIYLEGGDRNYTVLKEILEELKQNGKKLDLMERHLDKIRMQTLTMTGGNKVNPSIVVEHE